MEQADIMHLARMARIELSPEEQEAYSKNLSDIVAYVSQVDAMVDELPKEKEVGVVYNVFREDEVTNEPGEKSAAILEQMPERKGEFLQVKKILNND